eukprot:16798-Pelagomonas_calceolata.AAC.2
MHTGYCQDDRPTVATTSHRVETQLQNFVSPMCSSDLQQQFAVLLLLHAPLERSIKNIPPNPKAVHVLVLALTWLWGLRRGINSAGAFAVFATLRCAVYK